MNPNANIQPRWYMEGISEKMGDVKTTTEKNAVHGVRMVTS